MTKKPKPHWFVPYKKWAIGVAVSIVVIPALTLSWKNIISIWAAPETLDKVGKKVEKQESVQDQLCKLVVEQENRLETQEKVTTLQIQSLKELIKLTKDMKDDA